MKSIKVIRILVETCVGIRYAYVQQITPKSIVIIRDENTCEVYNRKTGKLRPDNKFSKTKILSLKQIEEFIASKIRFDLQFRVKADDLKKVLQKDLQRIENDPSIKDSQRDSQFNGSNSDNCFNCWNGGWLPNSDDSKVSLVSRRYFKNEHPLCQFAVVNNSLKFPDGTTGSGYDYERWFLAQGVEIIDLSK
jgi:hypothetical protein